MYNFKPLIDNCSMDISKEYTLDLVDFIRIMNCMYYCLAKSDFNGNLGNIHFNQSKLSII